MSLGTMSSGASACGSTPAAARPSSSPTATPGGSAFTSSATSGPGRRIWPAGKPSGCWSPSARARTPSGSARRPGSGKQRWQTWRTSTSPPSG